MLLSFVDVVILTLPPCKKKVVFALVGGVTATGACMCFSRVGMSGMGGLVV